MDNQLPNPKPDQPKIILAVSFLDKFKRKRFILAGFFLVILIAAGVALIFYPVKSKPVENKPVLKVGTKQEKVATESSRFSTFAFDKPIAKVGEELIYKKDLDTELGYFPPDVKIDRNKLLLDKIIRDSIILQGTKADGLISLDKTVYNSLAKDYLKRIKLVEKAKKAVEDNADSIEGSILAIWFYNTKPADMGYEKGKEFAFEKISKLHQDVKNGKITIKQAADLIKNDTSLAQVDKAYKTNAILNFKANKKQKITFDPDFNSLLWGLKVNEVSDIILIKDREAKTGNKIGAVYFFGTVAKRISSGKITSFDDWFSQKEKVYAATYY